MEMDIKAALKCLNDDLIEEITFACEIKEIPRNTQLLREGQYIKVVPIVLKGTIKVFTGQDDKELLLYYIKPSESCIMLLASGLCNEPSKVFAITEEDTIAVFLPIAKITEWIKRYPDLNMLFYRQYDIRYSDMLDSIRSILFDKMENRLSRFLKDRAIATSTNPIKISHRQIASELGTAREVITRVMKSLESEGKVIQIGNSIKITNL